MADASGERPRNEKGACARHGNRAWPVTPSYAPPPGTSFNQSGPERGRYKIG